MFLCQSTFGNEISKRESKPTPYPEQEHLSGSVVFIVNLTAPNKQSFRAKLAFKACDHLSNSQTISKFAKSFGVEVTLSCFKQLSLILCLILELFNYISFEERLWFAVTSGLIFSFDNPLGSH